MTPAERLRAAATRLREVAGDATPGPWGVIGGGEYLHGPDILVGGGVGSITAANADYIAAMHPPVALALAEVLDHGADLQGMHNDIYGTGDDLDALAVAILGGEQR